MFSGIERLVAKVSGFSFSNINQNHNKHPKSNPAKQAVASIDRSLIVKFNIFFNDWLINSRFIKYIINKIIVVELRAMAAKSNLK
jgi:hypothetical protein